MYNVFERISWVNTTWFADWMRERVWPGRWWLVPLSVVISLAGGVRLWFYRTLVAIFALVAFRLWDDLADISHDRDWHPERVLCRTEHLQQAKVACGAGLILAAVLVALTSSWGIAFLAVFPVVFFASHMRRYDHGYMRIVYAHVILLKVPVLVMAMSQGDATRIDFWQRALFLYGFVGAYEVLHDVQARRSSWAPLVFLIDIGCLFWGFTTWLVEEIAT